MTFCVWGNSVEVLIDQVTFTLTGQVRIFATVSRRRNQVSGRVCGYCGGDVSEARINALIQKLPLELQYQGRKLKQHKREGMIAIYEVLGRGNALYGYEVIIIKMRPAEEILGKTYPERELYPTSTKGSDDWGRVAGSYGRTNLKEALERFEGLCNEQREGVRWLKGIPFA